MANKNIVNRSIRLNHICRLVLLCICVAVVLSIASWLGYEYDKFCFTAFVRLEMKRGNDLLINYFEFGVIVRHDFEVINVDLQRALECCLFSLREF